MLKITKAAAAIMLLSVTIFAAGCHKDNDIDGGNTINIEEYINPNYVPIEWSSTQVVSFDTSTGACQIHFDGSVPNIHPGSILAIDMDTVVHYIFVKTVSVNGKNVSITSTQAFLTDIFYETEFTLTTASGRKSKSKENVFHPIKAYCIDDNGVYHSIDISQCAKNGDAVIPQINYVNDGAVLFTSDHLNIIADKMRIGMTLDLNMYFNFGGRDLSEVVDNAIERYRSEALEIDAYLDGNVRFEQEIRSVVSGSCSYNPGYEIMYHNIPLPPLKLFFMVGPVPVELKFNSDLYREVKASAEGQLSASTGFVDEANVRVGFEWRQSDGISPVFEFSNNFEYKPLTLTGRGKAALKAWVFPRFRVIFEEIIGPSFDIKPYLADTLSGGFVEQTGGQDNDYIALGFTCNTGLDACCGLSLQFLGYEVENWSTNDRNIFDKQLFCTPYKVEHSSGSYAPEQSVMVNFTVYDTNCILHTKVPTIFPQVVKFRADGMVSSEYGIAQNGVVTVWWTPTNADILYAELYDIDGNVISWDSVWAGDIHAGDWVDLGLPSGLLWASRNVGADVPEDVGDYFAWGETEPKDEFYWSNYRYSYGETNELTKYCNDPALGHNGYTDTLTILEPCDDAATVNWGRGARTPTKEEFQELIQHTSVHQVWRDNGVGLLFTGTNGNSIFIPSGVTGINGTYFYHDDDWRYTCYWSSSLALNEDPNAWFDQALYTWFFNGYYSDTDIRYGASRASGFPIRPVRSAGAK